VRTWSSIPAKCVRFRWGRDATVGRGGGEVETGLDGGPVTGGEGKESGTGLTNSV
jgi:hypothetical protein